MCFVPLLGWTTLWRKLFSSWYQDFERVSLLQIVQQYDRYLHLFPGFHFKYMEALIVNSGKSPPITNVVSPLNSKFTRGSNIKFLIL